MLGKTFSTVLLPPVTMWRRTPVSRDRMHMTPQGNNAHYVQTALFTGGRTNRAGHTLDVARGSPSRLVHPVHASPLLDTHGYTVIADYYKPADQL